MERRTFLVAAGASLSALALPGFARAENKSEPATPPDTAGAPWRTVEVTTEVRLSGTVPGKVWLPVPLEQTSYQQHRDTFLRGNFSRAGVLKDDAYGASFLYAEWEKPGAVELDATYRVRVRDRAAAERAPASEAAPFLKPSQHVAVDGVVKETARKIVGHERDADRKARRIYEWMVENTERDSGVRGCGLGDVKGMLESGKLRGKCADLSSLFTGLCRASGVPAREVFGLRVLSSHLSKSIGRADDVTGAQHCRAEYYSPNFRGWVPVDPADVRKVVLEEKVPLGDARVSALRNKLFGFWEMNWIAFNSARDFRLPPAPGVLVNYLMYPYYAAGDAAKDGMDPKEFQYSIHAREVG